MLEFLERMMAIVGCIFMAKSFIFGFQMRRMKQGKRDNVKCGTCGHIHEAKKGG